MWRGFWFASLGGQFALFGWCLHVVGSPLNLSISAGCIAFCAYMLGRSWNESS